MLSHKNSCATPRSRPVGAVSVRAEISYVMVKPDGVQRGLVGEIISRFEKKGFKLQALKLYQTPKEVAQEHYKDLSSKPFYPALVQYIVSGPVVAMVRVSDAGCACWHICPLSCWPLMHPQADASQ